MNINNQKLTESQSMGLIWVTGYSAAGKTTVGKLITANLSNLGYKVIFLDGDKLREIFSNNWGYSREQRIGLAKVYFKLCKHLVSQGYIVVISAIALYEEIRLWVSDNFENSIITFLDVPPDVRRSRDLVSKNVYQSDPNLESLYDHNFLPDISINNHSHVEPNQVALDVINKYIEKCLEINFDMGRTSHWNSFYRDAITTPLYPSSFAEYVGSQVQPGERLLEVGSGNGRDSQFFSKIGCHVTAIDPSQEAVNFSIGRYKDHGINFLCGKIEELDAIRDDSYDVVYSRFCLHAMTEIEEQSFLERSFIVMKKMGKIFIECRSINDPLALLGEVVSPTERIYGHYRRFIVLNNLKQKMLNLGFKVLQADEMDKVSAMGSDNPVVIRLIAQK